MFESVFWLSLISSSTITPYLLFNMSLLCFIYSFIFSLSKYITILNHMNISFLWLLMTLFSSLTLPAHIIDNYQYLTFYIGYIYWIIEGIVLIIVIVRFGNWLENMIEDSDTLFNNEDEKSSSKLCKLFIIFISIVSYIIIIQLLWSMYMNNHITDLCISSLIVIILTVLSISTDTNGILSDAAIISLLITYFIDMTNRNTPLFVNKYWFNKYTIADFQSWKTLLYYFGTKGTMFESIYTSISHAFRGRHYNFFSHFLNDIYNRGMMYDFLIMIICASLVFLYLYSLLISKNMGFISTIAYPIYVILLTHFFAITFDYYDHKSLNIFSPTFIKYTEVIIMSIVYIIYLFSDLDEVDNDNNNNDDNNNNHK